MEKELSFPGDFESLEIQVRSRIRETLDRRTAVLIDPKRLESVESLGNYEGCTFSKRYVNLVTLILLTWYAEEYFQGFAGYVRYEIDLYLEKNRIFPELKSCLVSKEIVLLIIANFSKYKHTRQIFGTILSPERVNAVLDSLHLKMVRFREPKETVYRRGYKDKGRLRLESSRLPRFDWSLDEAQNQQEEDFLDYMNTVSSIVHLAGDWVLKNLLFSGGD